MKDKIGITPIKFVRYGDLVKLKDTVEYITLSGERGNIRFLNWASCDGFTEIGDKIYIILNLDYLVSREDFNREFLSLLPKYVIDSKQITRDELLNEDIITLANMYPPKSNK